MAIMLGALYKALLEPNEQNARSAAEEVAGYDSRLAAIDTKLAVVQALLGVSITISLGLLWLLFRVSETVAGQGVTLASQAAALAALAAKIP